MFDASKYVIDDKSPTKFSNGIMLNDNYLNSQDYITRLKVTTKMRQLHTAGDSAEKEQVIFKLINNLY